MTCVGQKRLYSYQGLNRIKLHYSSSVRKDHVFFWSESLALYFAVRILGENFN